MKRITATAIAAVAAFSLSTGVTNAADLGFGSSEADSQIRKDVLEWQAENPESDTLTKDPTSSVEAANQSSENIKENSSEENHNSIVESSWGLGKSSVENDFENSDAMGTTLDTIIGIGAVVAIAAGLYNFALQAGIQLPTL